MKLEELVKVKKPIRSKRVKMIITEIQFNALVNNVLNEQELETIKNTHLIKTKSNVKN
jgi:protein tyrosine phosphatase